MDLEFDKEMDALLRKAAGSGVLVGDDANSHLDADTIAAFAENALPQKSRTIYTQHLAACDPCRISLANLISLNAAAKPAMAAAAAPVPAVYVPWYRKLFQAPNLAYVMGGLVLVFGGLFGVYVLQNAFTNQTASVSMIQPDDAPQSAPARAEAANAVSTQNANANSTSNTAGEIPHSVGVADAPFGETNTAVATQPMASTSTTSNTADIAMAKPAPVDSLDRDKSLAIAPAAAPPPAVKEAEKREEDERTKNEARVATEQAARKQDNSANLYNNQQNQAQMMPGAGNKTAGPSRADVQRDNRAYGRQMDDKVAKAKDAEVAAGTTAGGSASSTRSVGGKTFELKQSAWYDSAYSGQTTKNVQRGTDEFRKLDSGLRNIANGISGTVVVVWKGKAYRIQ